MGWENILLIVAVVAGLYLLMIRPQQRRAKQQREHMEALQPGARVMTVHGIFGTIVYLGEKQAVIEVSPGVEMTILKVAISNQPVADEFEYDEEGTAIEPPAPTPAVESARVVAAVAAAPVVAAVAAPVVAAAVAEPEPDVEPEPEPEPVVEPEPEVRNFAFDFSGDEDEDGLAEPLVAEPEPEPEPEPEAATFPDVTDDASFASWWDEHFPKN